MSYHLIILPLAEEDIRDAAFWYNTEKEGLGRMGVVLPRQVGSWTPYLVPYLFQKATHT